MQPASTSLNARFESAGRTRTGVVLKTWWRLRELVVLAVPLLIVGSAVLGLIAFFGWQPLINTALSPLTALLGLPAAVGLTLIFGVLRKELSLLMLM